MVSESIQGVKKFSPTDVTLWNSPLGLCGILNN